MRSSAAVGAATRLSGLALFAALVCHTPAGLAQPRDPGGGSTVVLRGRVMAADEPAMPLRGARVTVIVSGSGSPAATSDDEGWFDVRVPARGGWSIRVSKAGYATAERAAPEPPSGSIAIALTPGAAVTGRVLDTRGVPAAGESVRVRCLGSCPAGAELRERGLPVGEIFHWGEGGQTPGPDPKRADYGSYANLADPDGNTWLLQEVPSRGR